MGKSGGRAEITDAYDYSNKKSVRQAFKQYLRLHERAYSKGDYAALAILIDLKTLLGLYPRQPSMLTERQIYCIQRCLIFDKREETVAEELDITQQAVHYSIEGGIKRSVKILMGYEINSTVFYTEEVSRMIELYERGQKPKEIAIELGCNVQSVRNKIKTLKKQNRIGGPGNEE